MAHRSLIKRLRVHLVSVAGDKHGAEQQHDELRDGLICPLVVAAVGQLAEAFEVAVGLAAASDCQALPGFGLGLCFRCHLFGK